VLSDLHLEFGPFAPPATVADAVVLAGDVDLGVRGVAWAARQFAGRPVIYVAGNHEYYGHATTLVDKLRARGRELGVHVLADESAVAAGVRFLGATLWTDFRLFGAAAAPALADLAGREMVDYRKVRVAPAYRRLRPSDTAAWHARSRRWLERALREPFDGPTVVVTHHAPSRRSLRPEFAADELSAAYASDLEEMVGASGAALWVHGHTHRCLDYPIGGTRVVSNQRGYVDEPVPGFDPGLVVTV